LEERRASLPNKLNYVAKGKAVAPSTRASRHRALAATHRLNSLEALELRMPKVERLIVTCLMMCGTERL
jgi:hypothetical protein